MRTRSMKANAFSSFLRPRSPRRSRSSCRYIPWNFTSCASSSTMAPVTSSRKPWASVPRRYSLASLRRSLRERSSVTSTPLRSVDVLQVALPAIESEHRLLGGLRWQRLHIGIRADQRRAHILRHRLGVATDVEVSALFEPIDQVAALVPHPVLNIALLRRVAREGDVHPCQRAALQGFLPFELIQEIMREMAVAEEKPRAAARARGAAFLDERTERRHAGAGPDHDDVVVGRGQCEMARRPQLHPQPLAGLQSLGDMTRRHAFARPPEAFIADRGDEKVRFVANLPPRGCDRIRTRRKGSRQPSNLLGREL